MGADTRSLPQRGRPQRYGSDDARGAIELSTAVTVRPYGGRHRDGGRAGPREVRVEDETCDGCDQDVTPGRGCPAVAHARA
ncbi:hypothetical protein GCM10017589_31680 [Streptomyces poonensis]|nr:hypothetical protein GCM10017589_31680 [Streptomyces poonensis]